MVHFKLSQCLYSAEQFVITMTIIILQISTRLSLSFVIYNNTLVHNHHYMLHLALPCVCNRPAATPFIWYRGKCFLSLQTNQKSSSFSSHSYASPKIK